MSKINPYIGPLNSARVTMQDVRHALDYLISIEPDENNISSIEEYRAARDVLRAYTTPAMNTIRDYALQRQPESLARMQEAYYGFTNDPRYLVSSQVSAVVIATLNDAWDDIGPWRR